jgi:heat shock protein HslJ
MKFTLIKVASRLLAATLIAVAIAGCEDDGGYIPTGSGILTGKWKGGFTDTRSVNLTTGRRPSYDATYLLSHEGSAVTGEANGNRLEGTYNASSRELTIKVYVDGSTSGSMQWFNLDQTGNVLTRKGRYSGSLMRQ